MPYATHRARYFIVALLVTWFGLMLLTRPAHGGWSADAVEVHATSALCPLVSACDDGSRGAIVVWQENTASGGLLKARRVLAHGDLDPTWSAPAAVSSQDAARVAIGAVSDGAGGAYVWWMENSALFLNHVGPTGAIATGWLARGRNVGSLPSSSHRPTAFSDGAGGIYLGWLVKNVFIFDSPTNIRIVHLGPAGTGAGGWPAGGRAYGTVGVDNPTVMGFAMDRASDGGLWLGWQTNQMLAMGALLPGEVRAARLAPSGLGATGWTTSGIALGPYSVEYRMQAGLAAVYPLAQSHVGVAADGGDGAFVYHGQGAFDGSSVIFHDTLRHLDGAGATASGWAESGLNLGDRYDWSSSFPADISSIRALADARGGVYFGQPYYASEFTERLHFGHIALDGTCLPGGVGADQRGVEYAARGDGGMFIASFKPSGATGPYELDAYIGVGQSDPGASFFESQVSYYATRYGDVGLTATGDGGAIFAWSQAIDRHGVYAIRLNPTGRVTGVPPATIAHPLRAWFVRGAGVRVRGAGAAALALRIHDVSGREVARGETDGTIGEWTVPGTAELPSGIYFASAKLGGREVNARVAVIR